MIDLEVLASGSRGNASLVHLESTDRLIMIDAGISPRRTRVAIQDRGWRIDRLTDVVLTHADSDHLYRGWANAIEAWSFTLHVHDVHVSDVLRAGVPRDRIAILEDDHHLDAHTRVETCLVPHDTHGTAAFVLSHGSARLGWATDLGAVGEDLLEMFSDIDALAIESNYDRTMQLESDRPHFLIDRITGGRGHLSNCQTLAAVQSVARRTHLQHVVLLHLSQQCNCPHMVRSLWSARAPELLERLHLASQRDALGRIRVTADRPAPVIPA